jgi:hypothetical protein
MGANQTRSGGERNSLGQRIGAWLGGRARRDRGRARTRAAVAVEGLEGRVVLSLSPSQAIPAVAKAFVQAAESATQQQPEKLASVINLLESPQVLGRILALVEGRADNLNPSLSTSVANDVIQFAEVDLYVAFDLVPSSGTKLSANTRDAIVASLNNCEDALKQYVQDVNVEAAVGTAEATTSQLDQLGAGVVVSRYGSALLNQINQMASPSILGMS